MILKLKSSFGNEPIKQGYGINSIKSYHQYLNEIGKNQNCIDAITWNDLEMDDIFRRINVCCSSVGEEYLYHLLHTQSFKEDELIKREKLIAHLDKDESQRLNLQIVLSKLGKNDYNNLYSLISNKELKHLKTPYLYKVLALMPIVGAITVPFIQFTGIMLIVLSFIVNTVVYYSIKRKIEFNMIALEYFGSLLYCCKRICKISETNFKPFLVDLESNFKVFSKLVSKIPVASKNQFSESDFFQSTLKFYS